jgi:hydroxylamine reductase (hybrid-cluster protein)
LPTDEKPRAPSLTIGYGKDTLVGAADAIVDAVKAGAVKRFFLHRRLRRHRGRAQLLCTQLAQAAAAVDRDL